MKMFMHTTTCKATARLPEAAERDQPAGDGHLINTILLLIFPLEGLD
jgi:hypothetical protein